MTRKEVFNYLDCEIDDADDLTIAKAWVDDFEFVPNTEPISDDEDIYDLAEIEEIIEACNHYGRIRKKIGKYFCWQLNRCP
jgi:hypothetical protein